MAKKQKLIRGNIELNHFLQCKTVQDFINILLVLGYEESSRKSGSHRIFKCAGKNIISLPCHNQRDILSTGVKRSQGKIALGSDR